MSQYATLPNQSNFSSRHILQLIFPANISDIWLFHIICHHHIIVNFCGIFIQLLAKGQRCIKQRRSFNYSLILHCTQCPDSAVTAICKQKSPLFALDFYTFFRMSNTYRNELSNVGMVGLSASRLCTLFFKEIIIYKRKLMKLR